MESFLFVSTKLLDWFFRLNSVIHCGIIFSWIRLWSHDKFRYRRTF